MAILNKIRQRSIFLILIIALALFAFIAADIFRSGGFDAAKQNTLATVDGTDISREDFSRKVESEQRRLGPGGTTMRAMNSVWEQELSRVVLDNQFEKLGITVEGERLQELLKDALQDNPTFQDADGFFSYGKMQEYIAQAKNSPDGTQYAAWLNFEKSIAQQEKERIYYNLVKAGLGATLKDGEIAYKLEGNTVDIQFVQIPYTSIDDSEVEVSKSEIEKYINDHKEAYKTEATRSINYVKFDEKATLEDENALKAELAKLIETRDVYNAATKVDEKLPGLKNTENVSEFIAENSETPYQDRFFFKKDLPATFSEEIFKLEEGAIYGPYKDNNYMNVSRVMEVTQLPDSLQARHILIAYAGAQRSQATRDKEAAEKLADSIYKVANRSKSKFSDLAAQFSADLSNKDKGGELWFSPTDNFATPFRDFVVENRKGSMEVVETDFGYHIIDVLDKRNEQKAMKIATVVKEITPSDKTISEIYNKTQKFEIAGSQGDFSEVAKESGYTVRPVNSIQALEENIPGQGSQRSIVQWAFEEDTKVGDIKRFQVNDGYIVAQVSAAAPKGLMPVATASVTVTPLLRNKKKAEIIKSRIAGKDLAAVASTENQQVKTASALNMANPTISGAGREPKVVGAAFGLSEGQTSGPIVGDRGVYVVKATKVNEAKALDNYTPFAKTQATQARSAVRTKVSAALKKAAEVEDNRTNFY